MKFLFTIEIWLSFAYSHSNLVNKFHILLQMVQNCLYFFKKDSRRVWGIIRYSINIWIVGPNNTIFIWYLGNIKYKYYLYSTFGLLANRILFGIGYSVFCKTEYYLVFGIRFEKSICHTLERYVLLKKHCQVEVQEKYFWTLFSN